MAEITYYLTDSQLENGTIDFYRLLDEAPDADTETLRAKIGAIYNYASANRDHRNLNKRREFQALLELLPVARTTLLENSKRARYDAYLAAARDDAAETDFETFINDLLGNNSGDEDKSSLLGVQENPVSAARPRVIKAPAPPATAAPTAPRAPSSAPAPRSPVAAPTAPTSPAPAPAPRSPTPLFGAIAGFVAGFVIGILFLSIVPAFLIGIVLGAIGYVALNKKPGGRIGT